MQTVTHLCHCAVEFRRTHPLRPPPKPDEWNNANPAYDAVEIRHPQLQITALIWFISWPNDRHDNRRFGHFRRRTPDTCLEPLGLVCPKPRCVDPILFSASVLMCRMQKHECKRKDWIQHLFRWGLSSTSALSCSTVGSLEQLVLELLHTTVRVTTIQHPNFLIHERNKHLPISTYHWVNRCCFGGPTIQLTSGTTATSFDMVSNQLQQLESSCAICKSSVHPATSWHYYMRTVSPRQHQM
eukprot:scaffold36295_cov38-Cyclotella_meneghiniana.AAC.3